MVNGFVPSLAQESLLQTLSTITFYHIWLMDFGTVRIKFVVAFYFGYHH